MVEPIDLSKPVIPWPAWYAIWVIPYLLVITPILLLSFLVGMFAEPMSKAFRDGRKFMS